MNPTKLPETGELSDHEKKVALSNMAGGVMDNLRKESEKKNDTAALHEKIAQLEADNKRIEVEKAKQAKEIEQLRTEGQRRDQELGQIRADISTNKGSDSLSREGRLSKDKSASHQDALMFPGRCPHVALLKYLSHPVSLKQRSKAFHS